MRKGRDHVVSSPVIRAPAGRWFLPILPFAFTHPKGLPSSSIAFQPFAFMGIGSPRMNCLHAVRSTWILLRGLTAADLRKAPACAGFQVCPARCASSGPAMATVSVHSGANGLNPRMTESFVWWRDPNEDCVYQWFKSTEMRSGFFFHFLRVDPGGSRCRIVREAAKLPAHS